MDGHVFIDKSIGLNDILADIQKAKNDPNIKGIYLDAAQVPAGIATIEEQGTHVTDFEGDYTTPCVDTNKECAYVIWENGITKCAIEKAWEQGVIDWKKPISCHLYPIRITKYPEFDVLNYDRWHICSPACAFGDELKVHVHQFLKDPLIRKYGLEWYKELEEAVEVFGH